ncbi:YheC/YheD family protein [Paenibacillus sp. HJGM_3]|uniref:YheC/YheD family protein n=1 Tax=Paenibacillus sp. HJGM_3 TaxID=3379816 RepID=UPI003859D659
MNGRMHNYPGRKWLKHESLWSEEEIRPHLPETELFSADSFTRMVDKHPVVFLKPDLGMKGQGVIKVTKDGDDIVVRTATSTHTYTTPTAAARKLEQLIGTQRYLVQQGVDLIRIKGHPIDFRLLLHLKSNREWRFFGVMGKVAARNRFVTNHARGGKALGLPQALSHAFGITKEEEAEWDDRMKQVALRIAKAMKKHFPNITELGLDVGIDTSERIWLIEANTRPHYQLFRHHSDPTLFRKIVTSVRALRAQHFRKLPAKSV